MKLQCNKDVVRACHQMQATEERLKAEIKSLEQSFKELKEEKDKIVGQLRTSSELADGRGKEIERLHMKHEETVDRLHSMGYISLLHFKRSIDLCFFHGSYYFKKIY